MDLEIDRQELCGSMWKVQHPDGTSSHRHVCNLRDDHGVRCGSGPPDHWCDCGEFWSGNFRPECGASCDEHICRRDYWHANWLMHRCHCGHRFRSAIRFNRPCLVRPALLPAATAPATRSGTTGGIR